MSSVAARPNVKGTVEQVMSGELFSGLLLDDVDQRALALEAVLGKVVDADTRVVWVGNPLRSALTIERFLIQIVGPEVDLREERGPAELARLIAKPVGRASRLLIVVQQPETINAETLDTLVRMGGHLGGEAVQLQFLFAGPTSFQVPQLVHPEIVDYTAHASEDEPPETALSPTRRRDVLPLVTLLLTITIGALFFIAPAANDVVPAATATGILATKPPIAEPKLDETAMLRREFDAYLAQRVPPPPPMTESEKDALFNGFLTYHRRE